MTPSSEEWAPYARMIEDSITPWGHRLSTMEIRFHRFVLSEFNTHRRFSRNSASSRAIPAMTFLNRAKEHPAFPLRWTSEKPGMQGGVELTGSARLDAEDLFADARNAITDLIEDYMVKHPEAGERLHKSLINRLLEPFMWHTVVVTSSEWGNFFNQRCSPLAQPEIEAVAWMMKEALDQSTPVETHINEWHLPYITEVERQTMDGINHEGGIPILAKMSAARCCRVSREKQGYDSMVEADLSTWKMLMDPLEKGEPPHASPMEHVARPTMDPHPPGNYDGWVQLRHIVLGF